MTNVQTIYNASRDAAAADTGFPWHDPSGVLSFALHARQ